MNQIPIFEYMETNMFVSMYFLFGIYFTVLHRSFLNIKPCTFVALSLEDECINGIARPKGISNLVLKRC